MRIDHIVLWVEDPARSLAFYEEIVGLPGVRVDEFRAGQAPFPSVRVAGDAIIDLMARVAAPIVNALAGGSSAGHPTNHVCLAMEQAELEALRSRLTARGVAMSAPMERSFGALGLAPLAFYFHDPDGNVLEARYYD